MCPKIRNILLSPCLPSINVIFLILGQFYSWKNAKTTEATTIFLFVDSFLFQVLG